MTNGQIKSGLIHLSYYKFGFKNVLMHSCKRTRKLIPTYTTLLFIICKFYGWPFPLEPPPELRGLGGEEPPPLLGLNGLKLGRSRLAEEDLGEENAGSTRSAAAPMEPVVVTLGKVLLAAGDETLVGVLGSDGVELGVGLVLPLLAAKLGNVRETAGPPLGLVGGVSGASTKVPCPTPDCICCNGPAGTSATLTGKEVCPPPVCVATTRYWLGSLLRGTAIKESLEPPSGGENTPPSTPPLRFSLAEAAAAWVIVVVFGGGPRLPPRERRGLIGLPSLSTTWPRPHSKPPPPEPLPPSEPPPLAADIIPHSI